MKQLELKREEATPMDSPTEKGIPPSDTSKKELPNIIARSVEPEVVGPNEDLILRVELEGTAEKVEMEIKGTAFQKTYLLEKVSESGGKEIWEKTISAPSNSGLYRYYATAYLGSYQMSMPGVSGWSFLVE